MSTATIDLRRIAAAILIAALPVAVAAGLAGALFGAVPTQAVPYVSDEISYWNQIATFEAAGFNGGYTTVDERPARASFSRFGPHGPVFSMLYGWPARLTGWHYASGPLFGAVAFVLGAALWVLMARPDPRTAALVLATFWPVVLAAPNTMQESLHFAIGCVLAALLGSTLADGPAPRGRVWLTWGALSVAALVRPVWALAAIGFGWQLARPRSVAAGLRGMLAGAAACGGLYLLFAALAAPYPTAAGGWDTVSRGPIAAAMVLMRAARESAAHWLSSDAEPLELFYRVEVLVVAGAASFSALRARDMATRRLAGAMALTLWLVLLANLALRNIGTWQDYRTATPVLLMVVAAGVARRARWTWAVIGAHVLVTPLMVATFKDFHAERFDRDRTTPIAHFAASVAGHIRYDPSLSGWGNTVLISAGRYDAPLMGLPRGVAISAVFDWNELSMPARSRYLLLSAAETVALDSRMRLQRLTETPLGTLYENEDWARGSR